MYCLDGRWRRQSLVYLETEDSSANVGAAPSGRPEGMFLGRYSEIFGRGERLGVF